MTGNISKAKALKGDPGKDGHTPSITFAYDPDSGNLYYSSDGIMVDKDYIDSQNLATKEYVKELLGELGIVSPTTEKASITLYADIWEQSESENMWHQEVVVANATVTEYSKIDLQPNVEQMLVFYEKDLTFVTENDGGKITVYCIGQRPANDYAIQATITEVKIDGE